MNQTYREGTGIDPAPVLAEIEQAAAAVTAAARLTGHADDCECSVCWELGIVRVALVVAAAEAPGLAVDG